MEDRVYNRRAVLQRERWNSEAVIKKLKEESEMEEKLFRVHCRFLFFFFFALQSRFINRGFQQWKTTVATIKILKQMEKKDFYFPNFSAQNISIKLIN